jgi:Family of unknown function (DUF6131)
MLILRLILLVPGYLTNIGILVTLGVILLVVAAVLWILGSMGRPVGGRRHYWQHWRPRWLMRRSCKDIVAVGGHLTAAGEGLRHSLLPWCPNS